MLLYSPLIQTLLLNWEMKPNPTSLQNSIIFLTVFSLPAEPAATGNPSPFPHGSRAQPTQHHTGVGTGHSTRWRCFTLPQAACAISQQLPNCHCAGDSRDSSSVTIRNVLFHSRFSLLHSGPAAAQGMKAHSAQAAPLCWSWDLSRDFTTANMMFAWEVLMPTAASCL